MKFYELLICLQFYDIILCALIHEQEYTKQITPSSLRAEQIDQLKFINNVEYTGRIIVNTTRIEGFVERFCLNHAGYSFRRQVEFVQQEVRQPRVLKTADPEWYKLWHLNGEISPSMQINEAWNSGYTGRGIKIAILDDGLQTNHLDLVSNVDKVNDYDYIDDDYNPMPPNGSSHGTKVAGLIAAEKDNNKCIVGVAHHSSIVGVRLLGRRGLTDSEEAQALNHHINEIDIYSNSWGPTEGYGFFGPGVLTNEALTAGVQNGRNGKGAIYVWAAGNGGTTDNCNADGYVNSIYTVAITSVQLGQNAYYSEVCAPALAATYGGSEEDRYLTTTSTNDECNTYGNQGTSFSVPIASGIIALALQANPNLTWRDVQHLIVLTSSRKGFNDTYSDCSTSLWSSDTIHFSRSNIFIRYLEHVTVRIEFSYNRYRGVTELYLVSPSGTESHLLHYRYKDAIKYKTEGSLIWTFMSVHFWWENPVGTWRLKVGSYNGLCIEERTTVPTNKSKNTSDPKYVSTTTTSASIPTSFTEPTSTNSASIPTSFTEPTSTTSASIPTSFTEPTSTTSATIPTSFTELTSTSKAAQFVTVTTSDKLTTGTAIISDWTTLSTKPTTSSRGSDLSFLTSDNKPVIIGGFVAGLLILGAVLVFIGWKINVGRKKAVDSTTPSTEPAVFTA
ncbi:FURIN [Mytilus edulis]|uniref:FURIN n=1 Tax=Mytilus edulis TaxID=6550 RepID=A0A8S3SZJ4_MYTED|nr:FURIN [Mytilus edulis]